VELPACGGDSGDGEEAHQREGSRQESQPLAPLLAPAALAISPGRRVTAMDSPVRDDSSILRGSPSPTSCKQCRAARKAGGSRLGGH
jgi:hypothetical protein